MIKAIHTSRVKSPETPHEVVAAGGLSVVADAAGTVVGVSWGGMDSDVGWEGVDIGVSLGRVDAGTSWTVTVTVSIVGAGRVVSLIRKLNGRLAARTGSGLMLQSRYCCTVHRLATVPVVGPRYRSSPHGSGDPFTDRLSTTIIYRAFPTILICGRECNVRCRSIRVGW